MNFECWRIQCFEIIWNFVRLDGSIVGFWTSTMFGQWYCVGQWQWQRFGWFFTFVMWTDSGMLYRIKTQSHRRRVDTISSQMCAVCHRAERNQNCTSSLVVWWTYTGWSESGIWFWFRVTEGGNVRNVIQHRPLWSYHAHIMLILWPLFRSYLSPCPSYASSFLPSNAMQCWVVR